MSRRLICHKVTKIKKKNIYVDRQILLINAMADVIIQLHDKTGCDHNYGFYGCRKKNSHRKSYKKLETKNSVT